MYTWTKHLSFHDSRSATGRLLLLIGATVPVSESNAGTDQVEFLARARAARRGLRATATS